MLGAAVVRTWSYCGDLGPVKTFLRGASTNGHEVGTLVEMTTGLKTRPLRWVVMVKVRMASALLPEGAEAQKGP